jgi:hypothetical protein
VLAFLRALDRRATAAVLAMGAAAGVLLGASWMAKETLVLFVPALAAVAWVAGRGRAPRAWMAAGACAGALALVVGAECWWYARATGDGLFRMHELARNFDQCRENFGVAAPGVRDGSVARRLLVDGPERLLFSRPALGIGAAALAAAAWCAGRGVRAALLPGAWLLALALAFNFGSTSITAYRPLPATSTYHYAMILPGSLLLGAAFAGSWALRPRAATAALALGSCVLATAAVAVVVRNRRCALDIQEAAAVVPRGALLLTDYSCRMTVSYFREGTPCLSDRVARYEEPGAWQRCAFLLVVPARLHDLDEHYGYRPPCKVDPPEGWEAVLRLPSAVLYARPGPAQRIDTSGSAPPPASRSGMRSQPPPRALYSATRSVAIACSLRASASWLSSRARCVASTFRKSVLPARYSCRESPTASTFASTDFASASRRDCSCAKLVIATSTSRNAASTLRR